MHIPTTSSQEWRTTDTYIFSRHKLLLLPHSPTDSKYCDDDSDADKAEDAVGVDEECFHREDIRIETHTSKCYPIDDFCRFIGLCAEAPDGEETDNRIDDECEVGERDSCDHRIWMDDDI